MKSRLSKVVTTFARIFGVKVFDCYTGEFIGKVLIIPSFKKVNFIFSNNIPIVPVFPAQKRIRYCIQELGFTVHPEPDFDNEQNG